MKWIRERVLSGKLFSGTFLNLGCGLTAEMAGNAGFDFVLVDLEHGAADQDRLIQLMQAVAATPAAPLVRVAWNDAPRFKRALDAGPSGIMAPMVNTAEEARRAVSAMRYPPHGVRGLATSSRAAGFGREFKDYFERASEQLLTIVQIETPEAVKNAEAIAAVDGADVLFVGPMDLSVNLGIVRQLDHAWMIESYEKVVEACRRHGKVAGVLASGENLLAGFIERGFSFVALGTEATTLAAALAQQAAAFEPFREQ